MSDFCYYYPIEPNRGFIEDSHSIPAFELNMQFNQMDCRFSLHTDTSKAPWFAKLVVTNVGDEETVTKLLPIITMLPEHLRSVLTLIWRPDVVFIPVEICNFQDPLNPRAFRCNLKAAPHNAFDAERAKNLFAITLQFKEQFELFSEGFNDAIPAKYRYLSLFKLFESKYRLASEQEASLKILKQEDIPDGLTKSLRKELKDVRDRCAHTSYGRATKGVSALSAKDMKKINDLLPILLKLGALIISDISGGNLKFSGELKWHRYAYKDNSQIN